ncbi:N-acetylmuramoyl-L-alanine amidase, family 3 [Roseovarius sp. TM1035]|uniref:N-acetylmuramoyl-L-alanine amidase n=1 Tax=Roseovarius sp. TM1035 TaxID=391613 RepID=UPI00015568B0|nr:N-acetylmuramoyl-L-alanine amidase [Roseovarius sp. TM1035]AWZ21876.1 N-acetylmuramoyl-L-alanine amidase [Roseovarius sp. AK1035]EDM32068.1 N-acetylmuramoyl-L-alanine amidase, family 3 [Roseovarius sp. TM1035]
MSRIIGIGLALALVMGGAAVRAQESVFSGLARLEANASSITDSRRGVEVTLSLSQGVPYRVYTLDAPPRLVLDFQEVDWQGIGAEDLIAGARVKGLRLGQIRPGWSRMVADLDAPYPLEQAGLEIDRVSGRATLKVALGAADAERFAATAGTPALPGWDLPDPKDALAAVPVGVPGEGPLVVVLDPGHGGIDPGAQEGELTEKALMLQFAQELRDELLRAGGFEVVLTRERDEFVSLERRVALAHWAGADVFLSLHADALSGAQARGLSVYTLSESASDKASAALAERHNRADMLAGVDLSGKDDVVADVLMDLARVETQPRTAHLAQALIESFAAHELPLLSRPLREAGFSVLKAPDIPSVLIELGFLSSPRDLARLRDEEGRARIAAALRAALTAWRDADAARAGLVRQ